MNASQLLLNSRAAGLLQTARSRAAVLRISTAETAGAEVLDFGVSAEGGLEAGLLLRGSVLLILLMCD
jgi:methenyltetrahydromethanopterin cyclohydrolase